MGWYEDGDEGGCSVSLIEMMELVLIGRVAIPAVYRGRHLG